MHVHEELLLAAQSVASQHKDWTFSRQEVIELLPHLNWSTVSTDLVSRCCVNAPKNHLRKWDYFRRIGRGRYQIEPAYRRRVKASSEASAGVSSAAQTRDAVHVVVQYNDGWYSAECLEIAVVTQGRTLDEVVQNLREAVALHLEDGDAASFGIARNPRLQITYELSAAS